MVSVCGVVVATIAMVCTLSVYNGFKGLTTTLFSVFDPELKITSVKGKVFDPSTTTFKLIKALPEVELLSGTLQENALIRYGERQEISVLKGVDSSYHKLAKIDTAIIDGKFILTDGDTYYGMLGIGLSYSLGVNAAFAHPLEIYMPKRNESINMTNPAASMKVEYSLIGGIYRINQPIYDENFMLVSIDMIRDMLDYKNEVSAIEIKTVPDADVSAVKKKIISILGNSFTVKDRFEQQDATFKMVQIEKWVTFLMLCFILVMALFNVLGTLAILMIEKEDDVVKLRSMGADNKLINKIFLIEGWMISLFGVIIGVSSGLMLCFLQQRFGIISLGDTEGAFIVDSYPVKVEVIDILVVFLTVVSVGFLAALYPVHFMSKRRFFKNISTSLTTIKSFLLIGSVCIILTSCGGKSLNNNRVVSNNQAEKEEIAVTLEPIRYFAEKIASEDYIFFSILSAGQGPETYDPSPNEIIRFHKATAFLQLNLFPSEQKLKSIITAENKNIIIANLSEGMNLTSNHHHEDDYYNLDADPHIWTSFTGAKIIAENIFNFLTSLNKDHTDYYNNNLKTLLEDIESLESFAHRKLDSLTVRSFVIYHPALTYFAKEFNLKQLCIENEGKEPSAASLKLLIEEAKHNKIKVVFVQKEFDSKYAEEIAFETGARIVVINTLDYQWDKNIKEIVKALTENE